jgi:hypothetical protein
MLVGREGGGEQLTLVANRLYLFSQNCRKVLETYALRTMLGFQIMTLRRHL